MNKNAFQKAFDSIPFSDDFQQRTADLLCQSAAEKNLKSGMKHKRVWQAALAAVLIAAMSLSAFAVSSGFDFAGLAAHFGDSGMSTVLDREEPVLIEESQPLGDYIVTLHGIVSGEADSVVNWMDLPAEKTYIVFAVRRKDGDPVKVTFLEDYVFTPLVDGYAISTLDEDGERIDDYPFLPLSAGGHGTVDEDGVFYYLYETANLELFADHTVKFAVYYARDDGVYLYPSYDIFTMAEDGSNSFRDDLTLPHVLFTLPLDESKADPAAVQAMLEEKARADYLNWLEETDRLVQADPAVLDMLEEKARADYLNWLEEKARMEQEK